MKVGIVSDHLPGYHKIWSGAELIAVTLSDILKSVNCEIFFLTSSFDYTKNKQGNLVYEINTPLKKYEAVVSNFPLDVCAIINLYGILKKTKPDIVHINGKYLYLPTIITCLMLKIPIVYTVADYFIFCPRTFIRKPNGDNCSTYHGAECYQCVSEMKQGILKTITYITPNILLKTFFLIRAKVFDYFNQKVDCFVALSKPSRQRLIDYGIKPERVKVIYHYKLAKLGETKEDIKGPAVGFAGWISVENGVDILVDAFLDVLGLIPEAKLYLIGTGKEAFVKNLKDKVVQNNAQDSIFFLGKKNNPETLSIISKCNVVVVPHQWPKEFGPLILIEALAVGRPVITSKIGATDEFIESRENGFLIDDFKNYKKFAEKIQYLLTNPEIAERMGKKGKSKVRFIFENYSSYELLNLYTNLSICKK
ncbi:MAG: glycosyltransferase family 4 protein [bacterium]|nr:glycosyltransferase family 4 protein [bacterium]